MDRAGLQETRTSIKTRPRSTDLTWLGGQSAPFYHCPGPDRLLFGQDCGGSPQGARARCGARAPARPPFPFVLLLLGPCMLLGWLSQAGRAAQRSHHRRRWGSSGRPACMASGRPRCPARERHGSKMEAQDRSPLSSACNKVGSMHGAPVVWQNANVFF
jgi:hypothetical protein